MQFASLGSGSKGNATLVSDNETNLIIDCGFSIKEICRRLESLEMQPESIHGVLVTHEHSDHIRGVAPFARRFDVPVYASRGTAQYFNDELQGIQIINVHQQLSIGTLGITPVPVPHDAREPCQYIFTSKGKRFGVLTDIGSITAHVIESYADCGAILLEFNHDSEMLMNSHYPASVRQRVASDLGHLNNQQAQDLLRTLLPGKLRLVVAGHLSESNNRPDIVNQSLLDVTRDCECEFALAHQNKASCWYEVPALC